MRFPRFHIDGVELGVLVFLLCGLALAAFAVVTFRVPAQMDACKRMCSPRAVASFHHTAPGSGYPPIVCRCDGADGGGLP